MKTPKTTPVQRTTDNGQLTNIPMPTPQDPTPFSKPPCQREHALAVLTRLRQANHTAYFAGGCVRDLLLNNEPKDYDVATDAPPNRVRELFNNTQAVGQAFGVILVRLGGSQIEVATFRAEGAFSDGRRPDSVTFTTARQDAQRRDFTINGLFLDPLNSTPRNPTAVTDATLLNTPDGTVIDYVGGVADLNAKILRAIGDPHRRFAEDHLRLLRAVRFAARFNLTVERLTADAIRTNAPRLKGISPERIADELRRMLTPTTRSSAWTMLWHFALIDVIFRHLPSSEHADFNPQNSLFLKLVPEQPIPFSLALAAGALEYRLEAQPTNLTSLASRQAIVRTGNALRQALRISNEELADVTTTLEPLASLLAPTPPTLAAKKRFLAKPTAPQTLQLLDAIARLGLHRDRILQLQPELQALAQSEVAPTPLITGDDLVTLGLTPGPLFKKILDQIYDAQLENQITTHPQALDLARHLNTPQ